MHTIVLWHSTNKELVNNHPNILTIEGQSDTSSSGLILRFISICNENNSHINKKANNSIKVTWHSIHHRNLRIVSISCMHMEYHLRDTVFVPVFRECLYWLVTLNGFLLMLISKRKDMFIMFVHKFRYYFALKSVNHTMPHLPHVNTWITISVPNIMILTLFLLYNVLLNNEMSEKEAKVFPSR